MDEMKQGFNQEIRHLCEEVQNLKAENELMKAEIETLKGKKGKQKRESVPADLSVSKLDISISRSIVSRSGWGLVQGQDVIFSCCQIRVQKSRFLLYGQIFTFI